MRDEFQTHYFNTQEGLRKKRVPDQVAQLIEVLMQLSYFQDRNTAPVARMDELAEAVKTHPGNVRRVIKEAKAAGMIDEQPHGSWFVYEVRPDWPQWDLPPRFAFEREERAEKALRRMISAAQTDPEQISLRLRDEVAETTEVSRAFSSVVRGTSAAPESLVPRTTYEPPLVPAGTSKPADSDLLLVRSTSDNPPSHEGLVPRTSDSKALKLSTDKSFIAPNSLGAEGAAQAEQKKEEPGRSDADFDALLQRMWRVIPDQCETRIIDGEQVNFSGVWIDRAQRVPRAMRMAVDKFLESPPRKLKYERWMWLRAEFIANAHQLGLAHLLADYDQRRRGWWNRIKDIAHQAHLLA